MSRTAIAALLVAALVALVLLAPVAWDALAGDDGPPCDRPTYAERRDCWAERNRPLTDCLNRVAAGRACAAPTP